MVLVIKLGWQGWMEVIKNENLLKRIFSPWARSCQYFLLDTLLTPVSCWVCSSPARLEVLATQLCTLTKPKRDSPEDSSLSSPGCLSHTCSPASCCYPSSLRTIPSPAACPFLMVMPRTRPPGGIPITFPLELVCLLQRGCCGGAALQCLT